MQSNMWCSNPQKLRGSLVLFSTNYFVSLFSWRLCAFPPSKTKKQIKELERPIPVYGSVRWLSIRLSGSTSVWIKGEARGINFRREEGERNSSFGRRERMRKQRYYRRLRVNLYTFILFICPKPIKQKFTRIFFASFILFVLIWIRVIKLRSIKKW